MEKLIIDYWQELAKKHLSNQVFLILVYWSLATYAQVLWDVSSPEGMEEWRTCLLRLCRESMDYDVKEAAVRLSDRIEWPLLIQDKVTERVLKRYTKELRRYFQGCESEEEKMTGKLQDMMEVLLDIAAVNTPYLTTPRSIREMVGELFAGNDIRSMADICSGSGVFGLAVWQKLNGRENTSYCGVDMEPVMCDISRLMTYMCGVCNSEVMLEDILESKRSGQAEKFDLVLMDVPRGQNKNISAVGYGSWLLEIRQKTIFVDWIYILKALDSMDEKGKGVVIVTPGCLSRKNEAALRNRVIENDWIEAVITLPANLYPNARTGSEMIIFNKDKERKRKKKILFADISQYYYRDNRNYYSVARDGAELVLEAYKQYCRIPQVSNVIPTSQIDKEVCSLKPLRYIEEQKAQGGKSMFLLKEIAQISRGVQLKKDEEECLEQWGNALLLNIKDIRNGEIHYEDAKRILPKNHDWEDKFRVQENDIIITSKGTNFKIAIVGENPPEAYICGNLTLLRVNNKVYHPYVLFEYLVSEKGMRALESIQSGTTIRILNNANMERLQIPAYHQGVMYSVGECLKSKRKNYMQQMKQITEQYKMEHKILLETIGIIN